MARGILRGLVGKEDKGLYWRRQIAAWRRVGGTQADYCRRHGLSRHKFIYWKNRLAEIGEESLALVEIPESVVPPVREPNRFEVPGAVVVITVGGYRVEVPSGYPRSGLTVILDELESRR